jgi:hypothetical protein
MDSEYPQPPYATGKAAVVYSLNPERQSPFILVPTCQVPVIILFSMTEKHSSKEKLEASDQCCKQV